MIFYKGGNILLVIPVIYRRMKTKKIIIGGLMIALGLLLPQAFHIFGQEVGRSLSPMHIPVFIGGLFLGPFYGAIIGAITPILSFFITSMPPMPMTIFMTFELLAYGFFSGLFMHLFKNVKGKLIVSLILAMICGRVVYALVVAVAVNFFHMKGPAPLSIFVTLSTTLGILAVVIQLIFIPPIVSALKHFERV